MSRWIGTRGGERSQQVVRVAGFLLLVGVALPTGPRPSATRRAGEPAGLHAAAAPEPATFDPAAAPGSAPRREPGLRGGTPRPHPARAGVPRRAAGAAGPELALESRFTLELEGQAHGLAPAPRPGSREGLSHAEGIRGPPVAPSAAPRVPALH